MIKLMIPSFTPYSCIILVKRVLNLHFPLFLCVVCGLSSFLGCCCSIQNRHPIFRQILLGYSCINIILCEKYDISIVYRVRARCTTFLLTYSLLIIIFHYDLLFIGKWKTYMAFCIVIEDQRDLYILMEYISGYWNEEGSFSLSNRNPVHPQTQQGDQKGVKVTNGEFHLCVCGVHFRYEYKYFIMMIEYWS